ncbi:hypothetical protein D3C71_1823790 [compost metagenome]
MLGLDEVEIVGRGVIFGKGSESASLQQSNRQVEAWRTELALVIAVGNEVGDCQMFAILSAAGAGGDPVDQCISPAAALVVRPAPVTNARNHKTMRNVRYPVFVLRKP